MDAQPAIYFHAQPVDLGDAYFGADAVIEIGCQRHTHDRHRELKQSQPCSFPMQTFKVTMQAKMPLASAPRLNGGRYRVLVPNPAAVRDTVSVLEGRKGNEPTYCMAAAYMIGNDVLFNEAKDDVLRCLNAERVIRVGCFGLAWDDVDLIAATHRWLIRHVIEREGELPSPLILDENGGIRDDTGFTLAYHDLIFAATKLFNLSPFTMKSSDKCTGQVRRGDSPDSFQLWLDGRHVLNAVWSPRDGEYVIGVPSREGEMLLIERHTAGFVGSIAMNMSGTSFVVYDAGYRPPSSTHGDPQPCPIPAHSRVVLSRIHYETNMFGTCPRQFSMIMDPTVNGRGDRKPLSLINNPPIWNPVYGGHTLDFGSAAKLPSKKNFQIIDPISPGRILLQFCKLAPARFHIDFVSPFSTLTAFGLAVSSMVNKRLVT